MQISHSYHDLGRETQLEQCNSYLRSQLQHKDSPLASPRLAVTISHQIGSGAHEMAELLAQYLQLAEPKGSLSWTIFDRHLVEKVLQDHLLPKSLAKFMPEDRRSVIQDIVDELVGLRPPSWVMVPKIAETILHLADAGHVILIGRGANFITARLTNVFHVRLVASLPQRIARVQKQNHLTPEAAAKFVKQEDRARDRYLKAHFHENTGDDLSYHLVINTDRISCPDAAKLVADAVRKCFQNGADVRQQANNVK